MNETLMEKSQEMFESDPLDSLIGDDALPKFVLWIDNNDKVKFFTNLINEWMQNTKDGREFNNRAIQHIYEMKNDAGPEHDD